MKILRTNSENPDFIKLVKLLDKDLAIRDGEDHAFYAQFNKVDSIKYVVVALENQKPLGCGAIKEFDQHTMEIKRMYTSVESRGKGVASLVLEALEQWVGRIDKKFCSDGCRNAYNNRVNKDSKNLIRNTNNRLRKNYRILETLNPEKKTRTSRAKLIEHGFDFNYFTSIYTTKAQTVYYFVYDQGYLELEGDYYALVKRES